MCSLPVFMLCVFVVHYYSVCLNFGLYYLQGKKKLWLILLPHACTRKCRKAFIYIVGFLRIHFLKEKPFETSGDLTFLMQIQPRLKYTMIWVAWDDVKQFMLFVTWTYPCTYHFSNGLPIHLRSSC